MSQIHLLGQTPSILIIYYVIIFLIYQLILEQAIIYLIHLRIPREIWMLIRMMMMKENIIFL